jgi:4-oxalocrotonate tautomerase
MTLPNQVEEVGRGHGFKTIGQKARKEKLMPLIQIKLIEGVFTADQKQQMIENVTDAMVSVEGENMRPLTWVLVQEDVKSGDWGIGGQGATVEAVREIASGRAKAPTAG